MAACATLGGCGNLAGGPALEPESSTLLTPGQVDRLRPLLQRNVTPADVDPALRRIVAPDASKPFVVSGERVFALRSFREHAADVLVSVVKEYRRPDDKSGSVVIGSVVRAWEVDCNAYRLTELGVLGVSAGERGQGRVFAGSRQAAHRNATDLPSPYLASPQTGDLPAKVFDFACGSFGAPTALGATAVPRPPAPKPWEPEFRSCMVEAANLERRSERLAAESRSLRELQDSLETRRVWLETARGAAAQTKKPDMQSLNQSIDNWNADKNAHNQRLLEMRRQNQVLQQDSQRYNQRCGTGSGLTFQNQAARHICREINSFANACNTLRAGRIGAE